MTLQVNGGEVTTVKAGKPVRFTAVAEVPPGAGQLVAAAWDMDGTGTFPMAAAVPKHRNGRVTLTTRFTFPKPGTCFPVVRIASQRQGDAKTLYTRQQNLSRVRVVVH
ncbi:hypothetical protein [Hymenobacter sp. B1770]|uniref:hypothetical protein n=1 Tax=Hymenobacter sp. B1770 TaxID=1718788 RepID=UPI003CEA992C